MSAQLPEQLAVEVVRARLAGAHGDNLGADLVLPDKGRRPVALLLALNLPKLFAVTGVVGRQGRALLVVADDVEATPVQRWRRRRAPAHPHLHDGHLDGPDF